MKRKKGEKDEKKREKMPDHSKEQHKKKEDEKKAADEKNKLNEKEYEKQKKKEAEGKKQAKKKSKKSSFFQRKSRVVQYLTRAGIQIEPSALNKRVFYVCIGLSLAISAALMYYFSIQTEYKTSFFFVLIVFVWTLFFAFLLFLIWFMFYAHLDMRNYQRTKKIELFLPDYLELASANVRAGMTMDRALWYAVRPKFGPLSEEIEVIAKETISGKELTQALYEFGRRYNSPTLKRALSLIIEGIRSGGEMGGLLNKVSLNIKETQLMKKEMAANVSNYAIFITFSSIVAAPLLLSLSGQLLQIITKIITKIDMPENNSMGFQLSTVGITTADFRIFAIANLLVTSFFSAIIVAIIRKGDVKDGLKYIPIFIAVSIALFLLLSGLFGGLIGKII
ncbi:type II secretion system F family protein [Candidatus Woesearchaeota archaeon]|nr:type II secretion system F family protein [Candidatus Woesearchaeota archaeon]